MFYIGCHLSASDGFLAMGRTALSIGANTFQFFTRNPRGSKAKAIDPADVAAFLALAAENEFGTLVAHAPYTICLLYTSVLFLRFLSLRGYSLCLLVGTGVLDGPLRKCIRGMARFVGAPCIRP